MYRIETTMSAKYTRTVCKDLGVDPEDLPDEVIRMVRYDFNATKEVLDVMPNLLYMVKKGDISTIKIESYEDK